MPCEQNRTVAGLRKVETRRLTDPCVRKSDELPVEQTLRGLRASSELAKTLQHPGKGIRPCMAALLDSALSAGSFPNRNYAAVAVASELKRLGQPIDSAAQILNDWNSRHRPPLQLSQLTRALANAYERDYRFSCKNQLLQAYCIGEDVCPFVTHVRTGRNKRNDLKFFDYKWQTYLSSRQVLLYSVAIPVLERTRQIGKGGLVIASHRQLAEACGITTRRLGRDLEILAAMGLIRYQVGTPRRWEGKASEISRVFPVPKPSVEKIRLLHEQRMSGSTTGR